MNTRPKDGRTHANSKLNNWWEPSDSCTSKWKWRKHVELEECSAKFSLFNLIDSTPCPRGTKILILTTLGIFCLRRERSFFLPHKCRPLFALVKVNLRLAGFVTNKEHSRLPDVEQITFHYQLGHVSPWICNFRWSCAFMWDQWNFMLEHCWSHGPTKNIPCTFIPTHADDVS